jgi:para-aminobenzoate synthetase / 4-amino-4-deoxychorismate lyase
MTFISLYAENPDHKGWAMKVLIEFENKPLFFTETSSLISCSHPSDIPKAFQEIEKALNSGHYVAGFFSYEAGYSFEKKLYDNKTYDFPLVHFGVYKGPQKVRPDKGPGSYELKNVTINMSKEDYSNNIERIRGHIERGDVYQITYCIKKKFNFNGDTWALYNDLIKVQPVPYSSYIEADGFKILSLSPERFIKKNDELVVTEPMKGTWWRGKNFISDIIERYKFSRDIKNRAENIMIADLLRNDLGRIGNNVKAPYLYKITKYRTLYQMTSIITGKVPKDIELYTLYKALFPSGSVTGAPKIRAMELIKELEKEERNIYTGAIGYITPNRDMYFNIPIRTILLRGSKGEMGIGGGIVHDSTPDGEWEEGMLKSKFLLSTIEH